MAWLTRLSLANRLIIGLVTMAVVGFGVSATLSLRQELLPSTDVPTAFVTAVYPGASPQIVADDAAEPLQQAISGVEGVTKVSSTSTNGVASLSVEWDYGLDADKITNEIRTAVDSVPDLPDDVTTQVLAISTDDIPVQVIAVASDLSVTELGQQVNDIAIPQLTAIDGVRQVQVSGQNVTELSVTLKPAELRKRDLTAAVVTQVIQGQATVIPAGTGYANNLELAIEVGTQPGTPAQVARWPIPTKDGPVRLSTIADVAVTSVDSTSVARSDGRPALSLNVLKDADASSVGVSKDIDGVLPGLGEELGSQTSFQTIFSQAPSIEKSIKDLATEGALGLAFAVIVIMIFLLSVRSTLITALSIPVSLLVAMIALQVGDFSLNIFTLAALTVAVGRVVDDSIVVIENIKRRDIGVELTPGDIVESVREVAGAVTASTLTTVAVFVPLGLVGGVSGELLRPFALTVAIALGASLIVALTIIPVLAYWFLRSAKRTGAGGDPNAHAEDKVTRLQRAYLPVVRFAVRRPLAIVLSAVLIFVGTMASATLLKTDFIGSFTDKTSLQIAMKLPEGTRLSATSAASAKVEAELKSRPEIGNYLATIGGGGVGQVGGGSSNQVSIFAAVKDESAYDRLVAELQTEFDADPSLGEVTIAQGGGQPGTTNDIAVTVKGPDEQSLREGSDRVSAALAEVPGLTKVRSDLSELRPVLKIVVDRKKAARLGFTPAEVGQAIAGASRGTTVGTITLQGASRDIIVRPQSTGDDSPAAIGALLLPVSQLQQQQAIDRATDALEKKQDALEEEGDDLKTRQEVLGDDQERAGDAQKALGDKQQAAQEKQVDKANAAQAKQLRELRKARSEARSGLSSARRALDRLQDNPVAPPAPTPGPPVSQPELAALNRFQAYQQRLAQAAAAVRQSEAGLDQLDSQIEAAVDQRSESRKQQADADELSREGDQVSDTQEALADRQKALGDDQSDLGDKQADLAEEQADIQDIRASAIRVRDVADVKLVPTPSVVTQIDGDRAVTVTATPETDDLGAVTAAATAKLAGVSLPRATTAEIGGVSSEQAESFRQLGLAMLVAIVIVFLIMVATFRSLVQPLILLTSIPFAATGAVGALLLFDIPLGVPAMVGLLLLIGIVVTNAIVLIDLINKIRARGETLDEAVVHGARLRLRPIIMTATATICALFPLALALTGGGAFVSQPLAVVVIGGLVSSTLLTLVLVPALYVMTQRRGERRRLAQQAEAEGAPA